MSILSKILKAPLLLLVVVSFFASIYAARSGIQGITYAPAVVLGIIILLYVIGTIIEKNNTSEEEVQ